MKTDEGDILRIDRHGEQKLQHFCINSFCPPCYSDAIEWYPKPLSAGHRNPDAYWEGLVSVAASFGYTPKDIHTLRECGFTSDEIEDFLYCGEIYLSADPVPIGYTLTGESNHVPIGSKIEF